MEPTSGHYLAEVTRSLVVVEVWLPDQFRRISVDVSPRGGSMVDIPPSTSPATQ
jgi:hypothetical protein